MYKIDCLHCDVSSSIFAALCHLDPADGLRVLDELNDPLVLLCGDHTVHRQAQVQPCTVNICTLCLCILYSVLCASVYCTLYSALFTMYSELLTLCPVLCTLNSLPCTLYSVQKRGEMS